MQFGHSTFELNWTKHCIWDFYLIPCSQQDQDIRTSKRKSCHTCPNYQSKYSFYSFHYLFSLINMEKLIVTNQMRSWNIFSVVLWWGVFVCVPPHQVISLLRKKFQSWNKTAGIFENRLFFLKIFPSKAYITSNVSRKIYKKIVQWVFLP